MKNFKNAAAGLAVALAFAFSSGAALATPPDDYDLGDFLNDFSGPPSIPAGPRYECAGVATMYWDRIREQGFDTTGDMSEGPDFSLVEIFKNTETNAWLVIGAVRDGVYVRGAENVVEPAPICIIAEGDNYPKDLMNHEVYKTYFSGKNATAPALSSTQP